MLHQWTVIIRQSRNFSKLSYIQSDFHPNLIIYWKIYKYKYTPFYFIRYIKKSVCCNYKLFCSFSPHPTSFHLSDIKKNNLHTTNIFNVNLPKYVCCCIFELAAIHSSSKTKKNTSKLTRYCKFYKYTNVLTLCIICLGSIHW